MSFPHLLFNLFPVDLAIQKPSDTLTPRMIQPLAQFIADNFTTAVHQASSFEVTGWCGNTGAGQLHERRMPL